jgi:hypothetical protein
MGGRLICGVTDTDHGREALELALEFSERIALRLVLVHVADGIGAMNGNDEDGYESVSVRNDGLGAARLLARLAAEYDISDTADGREAVGLPPEEASGLRSMRERALLVGAALAIKQAPAGGLEVRLEVPATRIADPVRVEV